MAADAPRIVIIGGGLGGLWASIRAAEAGLRVALFSLFPVKRSHSVCAQGGINAVLDTKGQRDSIWQHIVDTIKGGDYLADQPPIKTMCEDAPGLILTFDRMGVTFNRTPEGILDLRLFGGVKNNRTAFAGATTGQQLLYACDEQVRNHESNGLVEKFEWWEFLSIVKDAEGICRGITAMNLRDMRIEVFPADAVILATGGLGCIYGHSTNSTSCTGAAASRAYQQGADFMNGEFIQFHPTAIPGEDKNRLISEAARGEGGRVWVPKDPKDTREPTSIPDSDRFYFLEEWYPAYGNTVPRDIASRAIWKVVKDMGFGVGGENVVYLDLTHRSREFLDARLAGILEIYEKFVGVDPHTNPMKIFPTMHYSMGGIWVDWEKDKGTGGIKQPSPRNHATSVPGLFACGECDGGYHGANRLGANSLLSASFSGRVAGESVAAYVKGLAKTNGSVPGLLLEQAKKREEEKNNKLIRSSGKENPFTLHRQLCDIMSNKVGAVRDNKTLDQALGEIADLKERSRNVSLDDKSSWSNSPLPYARQVYDMIVLAEVLVKGARLRDECRGAHYKPAFELKIPEGKFAGDPEYEEYRRKWKENNEKWLKTTVATHTEAGPEISFKEVDVSLLPPDKPRDYR